MKHVIKHSGQVQTFNSHKLRTSVEYALISNHYPKRQAKTIASNVTASVVEWSAKKTEITYKDIRTQAAKRLLKYDKNVSFLYKKHKDLW